LKKVKIIETGRFHFFDDGGGGVADDARGVAFGGFLRGDDQHPHRGGIDIGAQRQVERQTPFGHRPDLHEHVEKSGFVVGGEIAFDEKFAFGGGCPDGNDHGVTFF